MYLVIYFSKTPFFTINSLGNLCKGFEIAYNDSQKIAMDRINFLKRILKLSTTHLRAFYTAPENVEKIRELFGDNPQDLFFNSTHPESMEFLIQDVRNFPNKRVYYLLVDTELYRELHKNLLNQGSDFFDIRPLFDSLPSLRKYSSRISKSI